MKSNKAKFFCENCGSEVPENAKVCKTCGKFFISVRCPECGATGSHEDFKDGCPRCGYAVNKTSPSKSREFQKQKTARNKTASAKNRQAQKQKNAVNVLERLRFVFHPKKIHAESALPLWIYVVTTTVLVAIVFAAYSCIKNPY